MDDLQKERNVHLGGLYDARRFALQDDEYLTAKGQMHYRIEFSAGISSPLMSVHPPFFTNMAEMKEELMTKARMHFLKLLEEDIAFADRNSVRISLESFCYPLLICRINE